MRTLLISTLAATLVGCGCPFLRIMIIDECMSLKASACSEMPAVRPRIEANPAALTVEPAASKPLTAGKNSSPARIGKAAKNAKSTIGAEKGPPASTQLGDETDPVTARAMTAISAKMEDPVSAEFAGMKRAIRKNTLGQPIDTICGYVTAKNASGEHSGKPFLYLVKEDEAYVVDGNADATATTAYRNICK
jgi:hypothetical protein